MPQQSILLQQGMGGLSRSYATIQDLVNLSLPQPGEAAYIDSGRINAPYNVNGLNIKVRITDDGLVDPVVTYTFGANYSSLDLLCAAINIPKITAINYAGILRLQTLKLGIAQGIELDSTGTANTILGFSNVINTRDSGRSTITSELSDDEMVYSLVSASSIADSYLKRRYILPLKSWSFDLIQVVCDIAAYNLLKRRGWNPEQMDSTYQDKYTAGIQWLSDVGNRKNHPELIEADHLYAPFAGNPGVPDDIRGWGGVIGARQ